MTAHMNRCCVGICRNWTLSVALRVLGVLFYHGLNFMFRDAQVSGIPAF